MGLRLPELWTVVLSLSAVVNAARNQACPTPDIENGFFIPERETLAHDTELYYGCDDNFKPVEGTWWATVICQNGNWSSVPQCIKDTACVDPEIPNANYIPFLYMQHHESIWIRCNGGYEDKGRRARAVCQNGQWEGLPVCEKMENRWCEPPPQIPNAVIVNQDYKDLFPESEVEYMCQSGFEMEPDTNTAFCSYGNWSNLPSCREKQGHVPPPTTALVVGPRDIIFLLDTTMGATLLISTREFIQRYVNTVPIGPSKVQVGVAQFSTSAWIEMDLNTHGSRDTLLAALGRLRPRQGQTVITGAALDFVRTNMLRPDKGSRLRQGVPQLLLLMTTKRSSDNVEEAARALQQMGVLTLAAGSKGASEDELKRIALTDSLVFMLRDFRMLLRNPRAIVDALSSLSGTIVPEVPTETGYL